MMSDQSLMNQNHSTYIFRGIPLWTDYFANIVIQVKKNPPQMRKRNYFLTLLDDTSLVPNHESDSLFCLTGKTITSVSFSPPTHS